MKRGNRAWVGAEKIEIRTGDAIAKHDNMHRTSLVRIYWLEQLPRKCQTGCNVGVGDHKPFAREARNRSNCSLGRWRPERHCNRSGRSEDQCRNSDIARFDVSG